MQQLTSHEIAQISAGSLLSPLGTLGSVIQTGASNAGQFVDDIAKLIPVQQNISTTISAAAKLVAWFGGNLASLFGGK
jgi:hypothetical protein